MRKTFRVLLVFAIVLLILGLFVARPWFSGLTQDTESTSAIGAALKRSEG